MSKMIIIKKEISFLINVFTKCKLRKIFNQQKKSKILELRKLMKIWIIKDAMIFIIVDDNKMLQTFFVKHFMRLFKFV